jgi:hypothetical protein
MDDATVSTMMRRQYHLLILLVSIGILEIGCVHRIHLPSLADDVATASIPMTLQLDMPFLAIEGADHTPGIPLLEWPVQDLRRAALDYFTRRQTFRAVGLEPAELRLVIKAWLTLRAPDRYLYRVHLESELSFPGQKPLKTYADEGEAFGSSVRWITASDQQPIMEATTQALRQLTLQIEQDQEIIAKSIPH